MDKRTLITGLAIFSLLGGTALAETPNVAHGNTAQDSTEKDDSEGSANTAAQDMQQAPQPVTQPSPEPLTNATPPGSDAGDAEDSSAKSDMKAVDGSIKLSELEAEQVKQLQNSLKEYGYYNAEIDGVVGPQTQAGLRRFYNDQARMANAGIQLCDASAMRM